jgi:hypothetical protein
MVMQNSKEPNYMGFLPQEAKQKLNKAFDFSGGYYAPNGNTSYTGNPKTQQEMDWIKGFVQKYNRKPTTLEAANWKQVQGDQNNWDFLPGSSQYEMGWRKQGNFNQYSNNEPGVYGPYSGGDIKPGGIVLTDETGKPIKRQYDFSDTGNQGYLNRGQYIKPTEEAGLSIDPTVSGYMKGGVEDPNVSSQFYPKQNFNLPQYQDVSINIPDMQTAVKQADQNDIYQYKLRDYLNDTYIPNLQNTYTNDQTILTQIQNLADQGDTSQTESLFATLSPEVQDYITKHAKKANDPVTGEPTLEYDLTSVDFNGILSDKVKGITDSASSALKTQQSGFAADLPLWNEVMSYKGGRNLDRWYQLYGSNYIAQKNAENSQRSKSFQQQVYGPAQERLRQGLNPMPVSNRSPDFDTFINQNSFDPSVKQWLQANYDELYMSFQQSGQPDFIEWLIQTLGGG